MSRKERERWFKDTLKLPEINCKKDTHNCDHCALLLDDYIREGRAPDVVPTVPTAKANLFLSPTVKMNEKGTYTIIRSRTKDSRILNRCLLSKVNKTSYVIDLLQNEFNEPILDLIFKNENKINQTGHARLTRVDTINDKLNERLISLPRTADNTCFGLIFLTHPNSLKIGHVLNFFVDGDNEVYFADAQSSSITAELNITNYHTDVFFIQSALKEPLKTKLKISQNNSLLLSKNKVYL